MGVTGISFILAFRTVSVFLHHHHSKHFKISVDLTKRKIAIVKQALLTPGHV